MARDPHKTKRGNPIIGPIAVVVLLLMVAGLFAAYVMRPGRSPAEDARMATAIDKMDEAQSKADARREEERKAGSLL